MREARINGKRVQVSGVELRIAGECAPAPLGYFATEEHEPRLQVQDYERLATNAELRAARRALRKHRGKR